MRRLLCRLAPLALLLGAPLAADALAPGDLDGNGAWAARDALLLEQHLRGEAALDAAQLEAADVAPLGVAGPTAGDGTVDAGDLVVLLRLIGDADLDGDGLSAAFEAVHGFSPLVTDQDGNGTPDGLDDDDRDGLSNADEERVGFDPRQPDSDGDGILDSLELASPPSRAVATNVSNAAHFLVDQSELEVTPLQTEVAVGALDSGVLAVLRGTVRTRQGAPVAGVRISILDRPEFGTTASRADGAFDLAVNGGATLTVVYDHPDFLAVQRKATVPWQDYYTLPDVVLIPLDHQYTDLDLSQPPGIQVARGSVSTDASGTRQPTLLFREGTVVTAVLPDDTEQTLSAPRVRATEYTVGDTGPEAMPGELPPQSAYTYAVEFTVDQARALGAKQVRFSLPGAPEPVASYPVSAYLENFLGLPVGTTMPNGYYDHEKGAWLPEKSGVVLEIVGTTGGAADLDTSGDGLADDTEALGITTDERVKLAELYPAGTELWWVPLSHFSDFNIGPVFETPEVKPCEPVAEGEAPACQSTIDGASTILCESQVLIETVPVAGTPFALAYASDRTPGYTANYTMRFPLRDVPALTSNVLGVTLDVSVAGRKYSYRYTPAEVNADGKQVVEWDGTDAYGRKVQGRQPVKAELTYEYGFQYQDVPIFGQSGDGSALPGVQPRTSTAIRQPWYGFVGGWDARGSGIGGWTLSPHHTYDPYSRTLYTGDGHQRRAEQLPDVIDRVVGGGSNANVPADGGIPAETFQFQSGDYPRAVAAGADGSIFVAMTVPGWPSRIYKVDRDGWMTRFACFGSNSTGEGIAALSATCSAISDLVVAADGSLYLTIPGTQRRVRRITPDGKIWTVAGVSGQDAYNGDGIPAIEAHLSAPDALALAPDGSLYIADRGHRRIRRVDPRGTIWTIAGGGGGSISEGIPATSVALPTPTSVAVDAGGNVYFSATNHRVWKISPDGLLHHFAGNGNNGLNAGQKTPPGDGQPAIDATIPNPRGLAVGPDSSLYFATQVMNGDYHSIRRVAPSGIISTVAGAGPFGSSGDGGPAAAALLSNPLDVEVAPDGSLYISSQHFHVGAPRVRKIEPAFPGAAAGTISITSADGRERYEFDSSGRHLATYETLGNTPLYTFAYDAEDRLASIEDGDGNTTTVEHDAQGNPVAIVGPFGERTELALDENGWLASITDPAGGEYGLESEPDGLLTTYTDPNGASAHYEYGDYGYLVKDTDRAGGWLELDRTDEPGVSEVTVTSRLGRARSYRTERLLPDGEELLDEAELRTITDPAGLATTQLRNVDDVRTVTSPQGVVTVTTPAPDWRFGMASPIPGSLTVATPGGRTLTRTMTRTGAMAGPDAPLPGILTDQTDTIVTNGRTSTAVWNHDAPVAWNGSSLGLRRITSAASRIFEEALDARGRPIGSRLGTLHPVRLTYDALGRLETLTHGPGGPSDRTTTFAYHPTTGRLVSITDPASRLTTFDQYDPAGRVEQMTLPGGRVVGFDYDPNGNLTSLSPPGRPAHVFRYTPVDLESEYEPPVVTGVTVPKTVYEYDLDRSLTLVTRPDGKTVDLAYEPATGRLATVTIAEGVYAYGYYPVTPATTDPDGQLETLTAPGGQSLAYGWDGVLPTGTTWSGPVAGSVTRSFDDDFRVETESVNGSQTVSFQYDPDSLVDLVDPASGPDLDLLRDAGAGFGAGLLTGTTQGVVATVETPSAFGELETLVATESAGPSTLYSLDVSTRDALGRIETKAETIGGVTKTSVYTYDPAGRLDTVTVNGTLAADYAYDANGNRTHEREDLAGPPIAVYDDQDRLLGYAGTTYTYSAAGDLETKTDGAGTTTYGYDALGNLRSVAFPDGKQIAYVIDGQNRRVGKQVCPAPCTGGATPQPVQGFLYGDQLRIVAELDGSNAVVSRFVYASRPNVPDFLVKGGTTYRILSDQVGSVRLVVNATTGAIAQRIDYDAFGNPTYVTGPPDFQPFGFAGGLTDLDTGLVRFGARDYDPAVGRWTGKDPIRFEAVGANLYGYALGDPVNLVDVDGRDVDNTAGSTVVLVLGGGSNEPFGGDSGAVRCLPAGQVDEGVHDAVAVPGTGIIYKTPDLSSVRISSTGGVSPSGPLSTVLINYGGGGPIPASEVPQHGTSFEGLLGDANALGAYPYLGGDCQCTE